MVFAEYADFTSMQPTKCMMEPHLKAFLDDRVNPRPDVVKQASESQDRLRGILASKLAQGENLPDILHGHEFLFGSAVRGTQTAPFDDVDLMLVLDGSTLVALENGRMVGTAAGTGKTYNTVLSPSYLGPDGLISSRRVMDRIREVIASSYTRSGIRKDGQAINVWLDSYGFGIDVVPAFKITGHYAGDHYYIPVGKDSDGWRSTNPHADLSAFEQEDIRLGGKLRETARIMRKWNELSNSGRLSGFHVDALVYRSLYGKVINNLEIAVLTCLVSFQTFLNEYSRQFSGFSPHIDQHLSAEDRRLSVGAARRTGDAIFTALRGRPTREIAAAWNAAFAEQLI